MLNFSLVQGGRKTWGRLSARSMICATPSLLRWKEQGKLSQVMLPLSQLDSPVWVVQWPCRCSGHRTHIVHRRHRWRQAEPCKVHSRDAEMDASGCHSHRHAYAQRYGKVGESLRFFLGVTCKNEADQSQQSSHRGRRSLRIRAWYNWEASEEDGEEQHRKRYD